MHALRLVTLDLDDTLWAIAPVIARAENLLHAWLTENCPVTASRFSPQDLRAARQDVEKRHPELAGDLGALRRQSILLALRQGGDNEALADDAFEVFQAARNDIGCFDDVLPALARLKSKFIVAAVSNGNACVKLAGLGEYFDFSLSAREARCAKPGREIFRQACNLAGVQPHETLHAGDDINCDVRGALAAGMHAAWIHRDTRVTRMLAPPALTFPDLAALADHLAA